MACEKSFHQADGIIELKDCPVTGSSVCRCGFTVEGECLVPPTLKECLRKLFSDHGWYTHQFIAATVFENPNGNEILNRLLENQVEIGDVVKKQVGEMEGIKLTELLQEHIKLAGSALKALIGNYGVKSAVDRLFENSAQVAAFITSLNQWKLPYDVTKAHFDTHNQFVIDLATAYVEEDYESTIQINDAYENHLLLFSDILHRGLNPNEP